MKLNKKIGIITLVTTIVMVIGGGTAIFAFSQTGRYTPLEGGYYLKREDAKTSYVLEMPVVTNVVTSALQKSNDIAKEPVTLTYNHSEKGSKNNWDIYTDEIGNQYTYHELTGKLVSVLYKQDNIQTFSESVNPSKDQIISYSEKYLSVLIPDFSLYSMVSYKYYPSEGETVPGTSFIVQYGVPIGDYFTGDRITLSYSSSGNLIDATFPKGTIYSEMTDQEKQDLAQQLPSQEQLQQYVEEKLQEKYGASLASYEITSTLLRINYGNTEIEAALNLKTYLDGTELTIANYDTVVYSID